MIAKILSLFSKPKPKEIKPMSAEVLKPPVARAIDAYKKLQAAHADAAAKIIDLDAQIVDLKNDLSGEQAIVADLKAQLDAVWPEDVGGSMGGVTE